MNAVEVVRMARTAGVELTIHGDNLQLSAASEPPSSVIEELRRHKLEIVELLRSDHDRFKGPPPSEPYGEVIAKLRSRCPDHIAHDRWQQAIRDADSFLATWGEQCTHLAGRHANCSACTPRQRVRQPIIRGCRATTR